MDESEQVKQRKQKEYAAYVKEVTPTHSFPLQVAKAFLTGGLICVLGQCILNMALGMGFEEAEAAGWCSLMLVFLSALLTGLGVYSRVAKWGGAGALVPISGFANGVAASAIEYKPEGQVFGIGCKIFTIAGPVLLYGILASWLLGLILWIVEIV